MHRFFIDQNLEKSRQTSDVFETISDSHRMASMNESYKPADQNGTQYCHRFSHPRQTTASSPRNSGMRFTSSVSSPRSGHPAQCSITCGSKDTQLILTCGENSPPPLSVSGGVSVSTRRKNLQKQPEFAGVCNHLIRDSVKNKKGSCPTCKNDQKAGGRLHMNTICSLQLNSKRKQTKSLLCYESNIRHTKILKCKKWAAQRSPSGRLPVCKQAGKEQIIPKPSRITCPSFSTSGFAV
eukprot:c17136_g1_i3 orf=89-802(-)